MKTFFKHYKLPLLSGLLLWLAWPPMPFAFLLLIAFVPLFLFFLQQARQGAGVKSVFKGSYLSFVIWNTLTIYWIFNAGQELGFFGALGIVAAPILAGALMMSLAVVLAYEARVHFGEFGGWFTLLCAWISYEYLHQEWQLAFPWLTLGNGWAKWHWVIQWYEWTGVYGGSCWILIVNMMLATCIDRWEGLVKYQRRRYIITISCLVFIPVGGSLTRYFTYEEQGYPCQVVVIQPNIDPFSEKYGGVGWAQQLDQLLKLSDSVALPSTELFVWPETAIIPLIDEQELESDPSINRINTFLGKYKNSSLLTGAVTIKWYADTPATETARFSKSSNAYYDVYNAGLFLQSGSSPQVYHKTRLVPGVEQVPYPSTLSFLSNFSIDIGGSVGSYGRDNNMPVLYTRSGIGIAPAVCYESIFGSFMGAHVAKGAELIVVITNDGWWKNTAGYKQHLLYAKLRAIENRRDVARSANTGISAFINQRGDIVMKSEWWVSGAWAREVYLNSKITWYARYGDYIATTACGFIAAILGLLLGVWLNKWGLFNFLKRKK